MDWFASHTSEWLETLIRCTGIHNFLSTVTFTPMEKQFLANGLRFICTPSRAKLGFYRDEYLADQQRGWPKFTRSLTNRVIYDHRDDEPSTESPRADRILKFALRRNIVAEQQITDDQRMNHQVDLNLLDRYVLLTKSLLQNAMTSPDHVSLIRRQPMNCTQVDKTFMHRLIDDTSITCKPADKNLGLVLVDTSWYDAELTRMLSDTRTYVKFPNSISLDGKKPRPCTLAQLPSVLLDHLQALMHRHRFGLECWNAAASDQVTRYMKGRISKTKAVIPIIYLLIKVHKPKGLCGRPIVPCTRWVTTPASVLADHILQEILRKANIAHIVKDTKSFVNELEQTVVPRDDRMIFVTADIGSLYTNIDTTMGLRLIKQFLEEQCVTSALQDLLMALLEFVMQNAYLSFDGRVYHQIDGTAMGTAVAPTYANIIVYVLERVVIAEFGTSLALYRRFLDDVFAYIDGSKAARFMQRMNELHPKLVFEFATHPTEAAFLDLHIHKGARFCSRGIFDLRVHQKKMNLYLYIPFSSFHTDAAKKSFIQTELMRYIRNSSSQDDYNDLKIVFYSRLRDRGYPHAFLQTIFNAIYYSDRAYFLYPSAELLRHPHIDRHPPRSMCLQRRIARAESLRRSHLGDSGDAARHAADDRPPVFIIPYTPLSRVVPTRSILSHHWGLIHAALGAPKPIIAYQSYASLLVSLVHQKAKRAQELRHPTVITVKMKQPKLTFGPIRPLLPSAAAAAAAHAQPAARVAPAHHALRDDGPIPMDLVTE